MLRVRRALPPHVSITYSEEFEAGWWGRRRLPVLGESYAGPFVLLRESVLYQENDHLYTIHTICPLAYILLIRWDILCVYCYYYYFPSFLLKFMALFHRHKAPCFTMTKCFSITNKATRTWDMPTQLDGRVKRRLQPSSLIDFWFVKMLSLQEMDLEKAHRNNGDTNLQLQSW